MGTIFNSNVVYSVAEPKLFVSAPAPSPAIKKLRLRSQLRLQLCRYPVRYLFAQLLNLKVEFSCFFLERIPIQVTYLILFTMNYLFNILLKPDPEPKLHKPAPAKSFGSLRLHLRSTGRIFLNMVLITNRCRTGRIRFRILKVRKRILKEFLRILVGGGRISRNKIERPAIPLHSS